MEKYVRDKSTADECLPYVIEAMRSVCDVMSVAIETKKMCDDDSARNIMDMLFDSTRGIVKLSGGIKRYNDALDKMCEISHFDKENDRFLLLFEMVAAAIASVNDYAEASRR